MKNMYLNTAVVIGFATYLALGPWQKLWQVFGASNQLVAAIALLVVSTWLLLRRKQTLYTLLPAIFMLLVTISALVIQLMKFISARDIVLSLITFFLIALAIFIVEESIRLWITRKFLKNEKAR